MNTVEDDAQDTIEGRVGNIRTLARVLDSAVRIPGTQIRFGADSVFGLFPVIGDIAGAALSGYIVLASARLGAPASTLARMVINIAIDTIVGSIPILGDMFDVAWRSNMMNVDLLERHLSGSKRARRADRMVVAGVVLGLLLLSVAAAFVGVEAIRFLVRISRGS